MRHAPKQSWATITLLERILLVPLEVHSNDNYPNLPWAITVYSALLADPPSTAALITRRQAEGFVRTFLDTSNTQNVTSIITNIGQRLQLPILRCEQLARMLHFRRHAIQIVDVNVNASRKMIDGKPQVVACHLKYHSEKIKETTGTTRCSVVSDLTDQS